MKALLNHLSYRGKREPAFTLFYILSERHREAGSEGGDDGKPTPEAYSFLIERILITSVALDLTKLAREQATTKVSFSN